MGVDRAPARFQNKSNCKPCFYRRFCYFKKILTYDRPSVKFRSGKRSQFNTTQVSLLKKLFSAADVYPWRVIGLEKEHILARPDSKKTLVPREQEKKKKYL